MILTWTFFANSVANFGPESIQKESKNGTEITCRTPKFGAKLVKLVCFASTGRVAKNFGLGFNPNRIRVRVLVRTF